MHACVRSHANSVLPCRSQRVHVFRQFCHQSMADMVCIGGGEGLLLLLSLCSNKNIMFGKMAMPFNYI